MSERTVVQQYQHWKLQRKCSSPENNASYDITVDPWAIGVLCIFKFVENWKHRPKIEFQ